MHARDSTNGEIKRLRLYLDNCSDVSFAMVFGSFARGQERKDSDLNVAFFFLKMLSHKALMCLFLNKNCPMLQIGRLALLSIVIF